MDFKFKYLFISINKISYLAIGVVFTFLAVSVSNASNVKFSNINTIHGISMREANSVVKDSTGFIWVSSKAGVLRLTEDAYRIYQLPYETANVISVNMVYDYNKLLAFTNNGQIFIYNQMSDRFDSFVNLNKVLNSNFLSITSVLVDDNETFWIGTSSGLFKYKNGELTSVGNKKSNIDQALWSSNRRILLAQSSEISELDPQTLSIKTIYQPSSDQDIFNVSEFYLDKEMNRLWIGTMSKGLFFYDFNKNRLENPQIKSLPKQPILAVETITDSTILIGIDGQGLWEIGKNSYHVVNIYKEDIDNPSSLRGNGVYDIYCDQNKRVWVCTYSGGASYFDQLSPLVNQLTHQPNNPNSLVNNDVNDVIEDSRGNLWFATDNGISCWEPSINKWHSYYVNMQEQAHVFLTLCEDDNGQIWAGSYSSGVYVLDERTGKQLAHYSQTEKGSPFVNNFVFDIMKDSQGDIWIGGINSEVIRYQPSSQVFRKYSVQPINALAEYTKGQMLFGCTYGLALSNNETGENRPLISGCLVHDILVKDGIIWLGTSGDGLIRFDQQKGITENYTIQTGLPSNFVNSVTFSDGYLWLGTENGLCRFDPEEKSVVVFSSIRSLSNYSFNRNAHFNLKNGQLAWGTNNGVVIFNPKTIRQSQPQGKIFLQDMSISGRSIRDIPEFKISKPIDQLDKITLKYNQNTLSLEMVPIGVASGSKLSWKLEGFDEDWTPPIGQRILSYSNIPSKKYTLKIRLYDNSLSQILAERSFAIKITPPFWATWWFLVVIFMVISSIIYIAFWYYIGQLKQLHTEEKVRFFTNTAHDIRTSLTLIKAPVEELTKETNLSENGKHYLKLATEQTSRLSSVVTQLMEFQKVDIGKGQMSFAMVDIINFIRHRIQMFESLAGSKKIMLSFSSNLKEFKTGIDEAMMERIIDNLISNAVKYSVPNSSVSMNLTCSENKWVFEIKDQGIGISKKAQKHLFREFYRGENAVNSKIVGSGIGLLLVKNFVTLHGGQVSFESQENVGSTFQISIPVKIVSEEANPENLKQYAAPVDLGEQPVNTSEKTEGEEENSTKAMRILIVEDNDDLRQFMQYALKDEFEVFTADDGIKAWEIIQKQDPDLVVSDVMMPNMDGFELCRIMKSTYETSHVPIILLTALSGITEQLHGLGLGADDYLTKPFDMPLLHQKIKTIIQNRLLIRERALKLIKGSHNEPILSNELNDQFLKKMIDVVKENISNTDFGKEEFASAMNVSASLLYKKVKSLTDQSPSDFIKVLRLDHALDLLQTKKYTVTEVSELCGYASVGYFSTVFKKHFGKSPTEIIE